MKKTGIAILGSTGSIGTQALDVISRHRDMYDVELLTANNNASLLIEQALEFDANAVVICNEEKYDTVKKGLDGSGTKVFAGIGSVCDLMSMESIGTVVAAMVGFSGLRPTVAAIKAGKRIALANKETLVAGGPVISGLAKRHGNNIIPVDSEHSAIFQCLQGECSHIEKIILTASGGPFLNTPAEKMANASVSEALNHPRWKMGAKVTIDSADMMNKGFEMIEAKWLFDMAPEKIEIIVHPQSVIHSMVQFEDGAVMAQLGSPDMRIPIQYALAYPQRPYLNTERIDFGKLASMSFLKPDRQKFPAIDIAYHAIRKGGNMPCIMNAANEIAVDAFLRERIRFGQITEIIGETMAAVKHLPVPTLEDILLSNEEAAGFAKNLVMTKY